MKRIFFASFVLLPTVCIANGVRQIEIIIPKIKNFAQVRNTIKSAAQLEDFSTRYNYKNSRAQVILSLEDTRQASKVSNLVSFLRSELGDAAFVKQVKLRDLKAGTQDDIMRADEK